MSLQVMMRISVSILCVCLVVCHASNMSTINYYLEEVQSLSELPLEKLIKIRSSFGRKSERKLKSFKRLDQKFLIHLESVKTYAILSIRI